MLKVFSQLTLLGLMLLTACSNKAAQLKSKQANLYFAAGTQSLMDKNYTEALKSLLKANEMDPNNSEITTNLGMAYYFKGEKDLAIKTLKRALELNKDNSDASSNLASIYFQDGHYDEAEKIYKDVAADLTYDKQARNLFNLGLLELMGRKDRVAAEKYFKASIKEDENYCPSYFQLGIVQFERKQFNTALKNFKEATMGSCYNIPGPHYYQGLALVELGRFDDARMKFEEIDTRFKKSVYAVKARSKRIELQSIEVKDKSEGQAFKSKPLKSPEF